MEYLTTKYPDYQFHMVVGQDNVDEIDKWKHTEWIKQNVKFIVVSRGGVSRPTEDLWFMCNPHKYIEIDSPKLSSTMVRNAISRNDWEYVEGVVSTVVLNELKRIYAYEQ
jgi:nicotinate-nucleotide adenylyltransferase